MTALQFSSPRLNYLTCPTNKCSVHSANDLSVLLPHQHGTEARSSRLHTACLRVLYSRVLGDMRNAALVHSECKSDVKLKAEEGTCGWQSLPA